MNKLYKNIILVAGMFIITSIPHSLPALATEQQPVVSKNSIAFERLDKKIMAVAALALTGTTYHRTGDYYGICLLAPFYAPEIITFLLELYEKITLRNVTNAKRLVHEMGIASLLLSGISAWLALQTTITNN